VALYEWGFGDGTGAVTTSPFVTHAYGSAGTYRVMLTVTDSAGCSIQSSYSGHMGLCPFDPSASVSLSITLPQPIPSPPPPRPVLTAVRPSHTSWREGNRRAALSAGHRSHAPPVGTTFSFDLNEPASVSLVFTEQLGGRRAGRQCVPKTHGNRSHRACRRTVTAGALTFAARVGANKIVFQGPLNGSKRLRPGRHTVIITASNGLSSAPHELSFTIVR